MEKKPNAENATQPQSPTSAKSEDETTPATPADRASAPRSTSDTRDSTGSVADEAAGSDKTADPNADKTPDATTKPTVSSPAKTTPVTGSKAAKTPPPSKSSTSTRKTSETAATASGQTNAPKPARSKLAIVALILALAGLAVIGYGYTLIQQLQVQQREQVSALKEQLSDSNGINRKLQQQNGQILGELNQIRSTASTQQSHVDELQNRLAKAMQQVSKLGTDSRKDWLLAEVEYLLRLANQRVLMERSASGALSLLKGADKILQETDDVSIYPVRKALAQDILALEGVPALDLEGLFLKLTAINSQVDTLRLLPVTDKHQLPEMLQQITPDSMSQNLQQGIEQSWASALEKLGNLIVIRHRDDPVTPLLSPEQHYFLTQNLHLMLEQTQLALLQGKQQAFDTGLSKAASWIGTYFKASDPTTEALLRSLAELQGTQIAPTLPDISGSLQQLKTYLTELHNLERGAQ